MADDNAPGIQETFISHLIELRTRLVRASAVVLVVFILMGFTMRQDLDKIIILMVFIGLETTLNKVNHFQMQTNQVYLL